jgi:hypothetical protein
VDRIRFRIQGLKSQKLKRKKEKIAIYLTLGLHEGRPNYRRSLQPAKENIQHFKT